MDDSRAATSTGVRRARDHEIRADVRLECILTTG